MPSSMKKVCGVLSPFAASGARSWHALRLLFLILLGILTMLFFCIRPIIVNLSPSVPLGFYVAVSEKPDVGSLVEFAIPPIPLAGGPALPTGVILKPVAATPGDRVDTMGAWLWINGRCMAPIHTLGSQGQALPVWRANRDLEADEFFVFSARVPNSFDSRYFGTIRSKDIIAVRAPLWTWGTVGPDQADADQPAVASENP